MDVGGVVVEQDVIRAMWGQRERGLM